MALLNGSFNFEFGGRGGVKVVFGIGFERRLSTLEGRDLVGFVSDELGGGGEVVGRVREGEVREGQGGRGGVGAEGMQRLEPFAAVVGAPCGLAVDGDEVVPVWP